MENTTQESKMQEPKFHAGGLRINSRHTNGGSHSRVYDSRIGSPSVLEIQELKMQAPTILMVLESNKVLRIQEHS